MNTFQKISLGLVAVIATAIIMIGIDQITGWNLGLLIGWFPVTAWFTTWDYIKFKEGHPIRKTSFSTVLIAFGAALILVVIGTAFNIDQIILGVLCSIVYNVIPFTINKK